jgi:hypothetical protein
MIRASNLPVLLCIALYERQQYRDTTLAEQLGDFAEKYVGSLPRRLKAAGKLLNSCIDLNSDQQLGLRTLVATLELYSRLNERSVVSTLAGTMMPMPILRMGSRNFLSSIWTTLKTGPSALLDDAIVKESQSIHHLYPTLPRLVQSSQSEVDEVQCLPRHHLVLHLLVHRVLWVVHALIDLAGTRQYKIRVRLLDYSSRLLPSCPNA